jgi:hypothetical protein
VSDPANDPNLAIAAAALRMQLGLVRFAAAAPPRDERFVEWMATVLDRDASGGVEPRLGVDFDTHHERLTWWAATADVEPALDAVDAGGPWIAADGDFDDIGWWSSGTIAVDEVLASAGFVPHPPSAATIGAWAADHDSAVAHATCSTNAEHPFVTLALVLPGDDQVDQMMIGYDLFDALGLDGPPDASLAPMLNSEAPLTVEVSVVPGGIRSVGFRTRGLGDERFVQLLVAVDPSTVSPVGETLGVLGVDAPFDVSTRATTKGLRVVVHAAL